MSLSAPIAETPLNRRLISRALTNTHTHSHTWLTAPIRGTFWRWEPPLEDWKQTLIQDERRKKVKEEKKKELRTLFLMFLVSQRGHMGARSAAHPPTEVLTQEKIRSQPVCVFCRSYSPLLAVDCAFIFCNCVMMGQGG